MSTLQQTTKQLSRADATKLVKKKLKHVLNCGPLCHSFMKQSVDWELICYQERSLVFESPPFCSCLRCGRTFSRFYKYYMDEPTFAKQVDQHNLEHTDFNDLNLSVVDLFLENNGKLVEKLDANESSDSDQE